MAHGVQPVVEHGVLRGDVLGLEVARLVDDEAQGWRLAVGVGDHDRHARQEMKPDEDPGAALDQVVALVQEWRTSGARLHPANTLAPERWLRSVVAARPHLAGAADLVPLAPPVERTDLRHRSPAPAAGTDLDGRAVVVVCSTGVDIDLVPAAADSRLLDGRAARLVIVVPEGDDHPVTRRLADRLEDPPDIVTVRSELAGAAFLSRRSVPRRQCHPAPACRVAQVLPAAVGRRESRRNRNPASELRATVQAARMTMPSTPTKPPCRIRRPASAAQ